MFDSLDDKMKEDENAASTQRERWIKYAVVLVTSVVLFVGLIMGVRLLS